MDPLINNLYSAYKETYRVTTDSRNITPGCIFFAFKGATFDGNAFAPEALKQGAAACVISDERYRVDNRCIVVDDVLQTLQDLARYHRSQLNIPIIGITGTNGKTTTKELVNAVLSRKYRVHATQGNHNNHLGVPLTLLEMNESTQIGIVEMGANHIGEIDFLCSIANPNYGLITNVGKAHLEGFGSIEGVILTKTELYRHLAKNKGVIFVNSGNEILMKEAEKLTSISYNPSLTPWNLDTPFGLNWQERPQLGLMNYGSNENDGVKGSYVGSNPYMKFYFEIGDNVYTVQSKLLGGYNFDNAMAAVCVGEFFEVDPFDIKLALEEYLPTNNRSQYKRTERNSLILDCYNANPSSMKAAIENFAAMKVQHKVLIIGGMKELGADSETEHRKVVEMAKEGDFADVILVGEEFKGLDPNMQWFENSEVAKAYLETNPIDGSTILLKGSNGSKMWIVADAL